MSQTVGAFFGGDFDIEVSTNGTAWTRISGSVKSIDEVTQARMHGEAYTAEGVYAIVTAGKYEPIILTINALYTETASEAFDLIRGYWSAQTPVFVRFSPLGVGATNRAVFSASANGTTAAAVPIVNLTFFTLAADDANPTACSFQVKTPALVRTVTGNSTGLGS